MGSGGSHQIEIAIPTLVSDSSGCGLSAGITAATLVLRRSKTAKSKFISYLRGKCHAVDVVESSREHVDEYLRCTRDTH